MISPKKMFHAWALIKDAKRGKPHTRFAVDFWGNSVYITDRFEWGKHFNSWSEAVEMVDGYMIHHVGVVKVELKMLEELRFTRLATWAEHLK